MITRVAIALGSNIGDREGHLRYAVDRLAGLLTNLRVSPFIETEPQEVASPQPLFLNGAVVADTGLAARPLLEALLAIERERGRKRPHAGAPRTLDLDLVLFGSETIDEPGLTVEELLKGLAREGIADQGTAGPGKRDPLIPDP